MKNANLTKAERKALSAGPSIQVTKRKTLAENIAIIRGEDGHGEIRQATVMTRPLKDSFAPRNRIGKSMRLNEIIDDKSLSMEERNAARRAKRAMIERQSQLNGASRQDKLATKPKSSTNGDNWRFNKKGEENNYVRASSKKRHRLACSKA